MALSIIDNLLCLKELHKYKYKEFLEVSLPPRFSIYTALAEKTDEKR